MSLAVAMQPVGIAAKEEVRIPGGNPSQFHLDSSSSCLTTSHGSGSNGVGSVGMLVDGVVNVAPALHVDGGGYMDSGPYSSFGLITCVSPVMSSFYNRRRTLLVLPMMLRIMSGL